MNLFKYFREEIIVALSRLNLPDGLDTTKVTAEPPREEAHGDVATNAAMVLCKAVGAKPRDLAETIAAELRGHAAV
ncbi:MAG: arginine--tRNA ligase, partial [Rhodospirillales bacterium]